MDLEGALGQFDRAETTLSRLEAVWEQLQELTPGGIAFVRGSPEGLQHENLRRAFSDLAAGLPAVDGFSLGAEPLALDDIAQQRLDFAELGEPEMEIHLAQEIAAPGEEIAEYRYRFARVRKALVRERAQELMSEIDGLLPSLAQRIERDQTPIAEDAEWRRLSGAFAEIQRLLGSDLIRKDRWGDLARHLAFGEGVDVHDIAEFDWPSVRTDIEASL